MVRRRVIPTRTDALTKTVIALTQASAAVQSANLEELSPRHALRGKHRKLRDLIATALADAQALLELEVEHMHRPAPAKKTTAATRP